MYSKLTFAAVIISYAVLVYSIPLEEGKSLINKADGPAKELEGPEAVNSTEQGTHRLWFPFPATFSAMFPGNRPPPPPPPPPAVPPPVIFINQPPAPTTPPPTTTTPRSPSAAAAGSLGSASATATAGK